MYKQHFGLRELPFGITPDTSFSFASSSFQEAINTLLIATKSGEGFLKISGEVGTGKTLLCRKFLSSLDDEYITAYLPNPYLEPRTLLLALAEDLGLKLEKDIEQHHLLRSINLALLDAARKGKKVLVCLDEAQAMPIETLEALRLLSNLETEKRKLLQVVLFGQPELDEKLEQPALRQLKQRITFQYRLGMLAQDEMEYYVAHRLNVAGYQGGRLFSKGAIRALFKTSGGIPRLVNVIAHKAMMLAFGEGKHQIEAKHIANASGDTPAAKHSAARWWWVAGLVAAGLGVGGWVLLK